MNGRRLWFGCLYAASGAAALIYEITWTRMLALPLGHTVAAASTVLAAFMGGLAAGAWLGARLAALDRVSFLPRDHLRRYALLELLSTALALAVPVAIAACVPMLRFAYADGSPTVWFGVLRVGVCFAAVGLPAVAMGATFPVAAEWFAGRRETTASTAADVGVLYAWNTLGAAAGTVGAGFWLIPTLGMRATTWVGAGLNVVAAAGALWLAAREPRERPLPAAKQHGATVGRRSQTVRLKADPTYVQARSLAPSPGLAWFASAASGFMALVYEVAWTRLLAVVLGPTTYAFSSMAAGFIGGLAVGASAGSLVARRTTRPHVWLGALLIVVALASPIAAGLAATRLPITVARLVADPSARFGGIVMFEALASVGLLLPATCALGAMFPLAIAVASSRGGAIGLDVARVYTANTLGAVAGALSAGFALVPAFGLEGTFRAMAVLGIAAGALCLAVARERRGRKRPLLYDAVTAGAIAAIVIPTAIWRPLEWNRRLLASGVYKYARYLDPIGVEAWILAGSLEYYREGAAATVSVRQLTGTRSLSIDGKVDASTGGDMLTQRLLGLLPVLLHGAAEDVAVIGLGSGVTVDAALAPGTVRRVDVVELSPEVITASRFFERENGRVLQRPEVRLIVGDGRSHLSLSRRRYDVIVSEPSNPWMAGVSTLFTREFFEAARTALKPGGLLCQWAHTYDITRDDLRSIVRTFGSVFPRGTMWLSGQGDLLLIGGADSEVVALLERLERPQPRAVADMLSTLGMDEPSAPFVLMSLFAGGPAALQRFGDASVLQTDDRPSLEFTAPRAIYGPVGTSPVGALREADEDTPAIVRRRLAQGRALDWAARGKTELRAEAFDLAYDAFKEAITRDPRNVAALSGLSEAATGAMKQRDAIEWLRSVAMKEPANPAVRVELSRLLAATGAFDSALRAATEAVTLVPDDVRAAEQLVAVVTDAGDLARLAPLADAFAGAFPGRIEPGYYRAAALFLAGRTHEAVAAARQVVEREPRHARAQNLLGAACAMLGETACAERAFEASLQADPRSPSTYVNLGRLRTQTGDADAAARAFAEALVINPGADGAREGFRLARDEIRNQQ